MNENVSSRLRYTLLPAAAIIIGAQLNMNLFNSDFKISIGILVFSLVVVLHGKYPVSLVTLLSAAGVFISRLLVGWLQFETVSIRSCFPEILFYLTYGLLFGIYCRRKEYQLAPRCCAALFVFDYLSNLAELLMRPSVSSLSLTAQLGILLVAVSRTMMILFILICLRHYKFSLLKREHAQRYRLLLLISRLNGEVVLMQKNSKMIEQTMNTAYRLFQEMQDSRVDSSLSQKALEVAKDVHEIKKEYAMILRGLSEVMDLNLSDDGMLLSDIMDVLKNSIEASLPEGMHLELELQMEENLYSEKPYFFMSVLRNLLNNAAEASKTPDIRICLREYQNVDSYIFQVTDHGPGILPEDIDHIFSPGFSTKINYDTGEINRGLGLNLVKDLIENQWNGTIHVTSHPGNTTFTISIPKEDWKGRTA